MPTFTPQTFSVEEILTSTKMSQMDTNIDEIRRSHKGSSAPPSPTAGTLWLDDSSEPWDWQMYDGAAWISLGKIDPTSDHFSGLGPAIIVPAASLSGSGYDLQQTAIDGLEAWKLVLSGASGSAIANWTLQFYDDESLLTASNYVYQGIQASSSVSAFNDGASGNIHLGESIGSGASISGEIDIWIDADDFPQVKWSLMNSNGVKYFGDAYYGAAVTDLDGFRLSLSSGSWDAGTVAVYRMPEYQHT